MSVNKLNKTRNTIRNLTSGFLENIVGLLLPFLVRTIMLQKFGEEYLGLNSVFMSIISVLNLAELGFSSSVVFSLYKPIAENDTESICAYLAYFKKIYRNIGLLILAAGLAVMPFLRFTIHDTAIPGNLNYCVWYLFFLSETVLSYVFFGYRFIVPTAFQRNDILHKVSIVTTFLKALLQIYALLFCNHYYAYLACSPLMTIVHHGLLAFVVKRKFPNYVPYGMISEEQKKDLHPMLAGIIVSKIRAVSRNSFDSLCISAFIGLAANGIYQNYFYIMNSVNIISSIITVSMLSGIGNSIITDTKEKNYRDMQRFDFMYMMLSGWASICMLCLYQPFMSIWRGTDHMLGMPEVIAICFYFYILKLGDMRYAYFEGAGLWWKSRYIAVAESICNQLLNIVLVRWIGVLGVILATVISLILIDNVLGARLVFDYYFQNGKLGNYYSYQLKYLSVSIFLAAVSFWTCTRFSFSPLGDFASRLIICMIIPWCGYYLFYRNSSVFAEAKQWLLSHR